MNQSVVIVLKGYPRLSETFIAQEILGLQERGLELQLVSLRHPTDTSTHPVHQRITAPVSYLPEYLHQEPLRVLKGWWAARKMPGYSKARKRWLKDLRRDPGRNRIRRFGQALVLARELPPETGHLYAHFLHTPSSVTFYAAMIRGLSWSCSAHAKDIWTSPEWEKREKLEHMNWLVTCTGTNTEHLKALAGDQPGKVSLVYHGLDFDRFARRDAAHSSRDGSDPADPVVLYSVGRAVEKKGYGILLQALAGLPAPLHWRFVHIGGGVLSDRLKAQAAELGIGERFTWHGARPQSTVLENYHDADLFVLASLIAGDGDRDGLPNVLMEAQSQGLACLSTSVSAIPELIIDNETGLLVEPGEVEAMRDALALLIADPARRGALGKAGEARVRAEFSHDRGIDEVARLLRAELGQGA